MKKLVSVIVPIYNSEKYLSRCIESIVEQTYENIEIILINDGSKDNSLNICKQFEKKYNNIQVIDQKNSGVSYTRNKGISVAKGQYIMFVDSDDYIEKSMVEDMIKSVTDDVELVISGIKMNYIKDEKITNTQEYLLDNGNYLKKDFLNLILNPIELICICGPCCKLYSKELLVKHNIRFTKELSMGEDTWFNIDYLSACENKIVTMKSIYYNYMRENNESLFSKYYSDYIYITERVYNKFLNMLKKDANEETVKRYKQMYAINLVYANSINFKHKVDKNKKINDIKYSLNNNIVHKVSKFYKGNSLKEKVFMHFIKTNNWRLIYLYFVLKYRKVK